MLSGMFYLLIKMQIILKKQLKFKEIICLQKIILTIYTISFIYLMIRFKQSSWNSEELEKELEKIFHLYLNVVLTKIN